MTAGHVANLDPAVVSRMIGHQLPFIALIIPLWLVVLIAGWRGAREVWPAVVVAGTSYAITMYLAASFIGPTLPDILSAIVSLLCLAGLLSYWRPARVWRFPHEAAVPAHAAPPVRSRGEIIRAWTPYLFLIVFIANWALPGPQSVLAKTAISIPFGALAHGIVVNGVPLTVNYGFVWLSAAGTAILFAALATAFVQRIPFDTISRVAQETARELRLPLVTIASVVAFAYVANYSGMSATLASALSRTGTFFPFLAPFLGWLGVFLTGSDTSSNALFSGVQQRTAQELGINPVLTVAANSSGGVAAKMISPQSIAVAAAATKLVGREGELFRRVVLHSLGLVTIVGVITYVQAYFLPWMIPPAADISASAQATFDTVDGLFVACSLLAIIGFAFVARRAHPHDRTATVL